MPLAASTSRAFGPAIPSVVIAWRTRRPPLPGSIHQGSWSPGRFVLENRFFTSTSSMMM